jgi:hypothetical protein
MDEVKVNWRDLYMWNNCWSDQCDGVAWRRYEGFAGFRIWDLLPGSERDALYTRYELEFMKNNTNGLFNGVTGETKKLTSDQFGQIWSGIEDLKNLTGLDQNAKQYTLAKLSQFLTGGRVAVNDAFLIRLHGDQAAFAMDDSRGRGVLWVSGRVLALAAISDFTNNTHWVAFALAHEFAGHLRLYSSGGVWWNECAADAGARMATGLDYRSLNAIGC